MHYVTKANYVEGYRIWLEFDDRRQGVVDLSQVICHDHRPIFRELADEEKFRHFKVNADTLVWDNGLDLAPDYLYQQLRETKNNDEFFDKMNKA